MTVPSKYMNTQKVAVSIRMLSCSKLDSLFGTTFTFVLYSRSHYKMLKGVFNTHYLKEIAKNLTMMNQKANHFNVSQGLSHNIKKCTAVKFPHILICDYLM